MSLRSGAIKEGPTGDVCSEGGVASSGNAAQFIKALTRMVCNVYGSLTSQRLAQCAKVNSWISLMFAFEMSTCFRICNCHRRVHPALEIPS